MLRLHKDTVERLTNFTADVLKRTPGRFVDDLTDDELDVFYKDVEKFLERLNLWRNLVADRNEEANESHTT